MVFLLFNPKVNMFFHFSWADVENHDLSYWVTIYYYCMSHFIMYYFYTLHFYDVSNQMSHVNYVLYVTFLLRDGKAKPEVLIIIIMNSTYIAQKS